MVCVACLLPLFLVPIVNLLPLLFDFIVGRIYRLLGWEYRKPERAPPACPYKPPTTKKEIDNNRLLLNIREWMSLLAYNRAIDASEMRDSMLSNLARAQIVLMRSSLEGVEVDRGEPRHVANPVGVDDSKQD
ncbi:hypothetical protein ACFE04_002181 [Oxalis oulophora]